MSIIQNSKQDHLLTTSLIAELGSSFKSLSTFSSDLPLIIITAFRSFTVDSAIRDRVLCTSNQRSDTTLQYNNGPYKMSRKTQTAGL